MAKSYFQNFPTIKYLGYNATDIISNAKLVNKYVNIPYVYYKMYLDKDQRPDQIADEYYNDPYYSWLVYYSNKVTDPYYDWTLTESDFNKSIAVKYGSIEFAKKKILFFRTNWYNDEREISQSDFTNRFGTYTSPHSNYWNPKYDINNGTLISYVRKINDTVVHTNKLLKIQVSNNSTANTSKFTSGDLVDIKLGVNEVGTAEVIKANTSVIYLEKQLGDMANTYTIHQDSNTNIYCTATEIKSSYANGDTSWTKTNLSNDVYIYWEPVYAYDYEEELNELKRNINLVDDDLAFDVFDKLRESMEE